MCVGLEIFGLNLQGEVDVVACERRPRVHRLARQIGVVEHLERNANWDTLVGKLGSDRDSASPEEN